MKKYNIINNTLGWIVFAIAAITYLLTIEPTASFWDCPEFVAQGFKTEIGHPPGNPVFILTARFASLFAGGDVSAVAKCVNAMSALFSAATILLLFWTITHLVKKLLVRNGEEDSMSLAQYLVIMGSGICGALMYTWSDTFWFSAVEAEVYAFSSFCTALVFWLILKWENRADEPDSDRWLILIAYIFGVSLGVHLLNLLCIPAIALVYYYRKFQNTSAKGSLITLGISFAIIVFILYGLEPGFVEMGQFSDLFAVNTLGMSFNSGVVIYGILLVAALAWNIYELYKQSSETRMKISFLLAILLSGMLLIGDGWLLPLILLVGLCFYLFKACKTVPVRIFSNISLSILVIFIGFASYGLIIIRSSANTPLDENSPNNTFALAKYLSREQYGETPLLYGRTAKSQVMRDANGGIMSDKGRTLYAEQVKDQPSDADHYIATGQKEDYQYAPEQNMLFPRIYSDQHMQQYVDWLGESAFVPVEVTLSEDGRKGQGVKPTFIANLTWFIDYQLNYMYWRYFLWNFAGRQNDIQGMGEITQGNWISGIPLIDNARLGDQSLLPDDYGKGNKGHNVFYMLPLLLGLIGLLWQAWRGKKGIEQFWVVFFLFFMTGIAIVMYLNQTPSQPRERDYAYAGSFYAYAIWVGMGIAALWSIMCKFLAKKDKKSGEKENVSVNSKGLAMAGVAALVGVLVPLQVVSQTWDDHDRSGRYAARDFGMNYLSSVDPNGIIFTNGDNDTFPLWYCQEVEGYRTDVRVVNLSYLSTDWYIWQMQRAAYESAPLPMQANKHTYAYDRRSGTYILPPESDYYAMAKCDSVAVPATKALEMAYAFDNSSTILDAPVLQYSNMFIPVDAQKAVAAGVIPAERADMAAEKIDFDFAGSSYLTSSQLMSLDIITNSIGQGWKRPCYFAMTVPESYYLGLSPYLRNTGMAYQVTPLYDPTASRNGISTNTDKMYEVVTKKFRWGGIDTAKPGEIYLDETIRRMVTTTRSAMMQLAEDLVNEGLIANSAQVNGTSTFLGKDPKAFAGDRYKKARTVLDLIREKLPTDNCPYGPGMGQRMADAYLSLAEASGDESAKKIGLEILENEIIRYSKYMRFYESLTPSQQGRLSYYDSMIMQRLYYSQLLDYLQANPQGEQALLAKVGETGVNMANLRGMLEAYKEQLNAREQEERIQVVETPDTEGLMPEMDEY